MKGSRTCLLFLLAALTCRVRAQNTAGLTVARDQCSLVPRPVDTHPGAEAVISTLVDLSQFGDGVFGCGAPIPGSIKIYEALLWAADRINQDSGAINGEPVSDSYVPGIKIGLSVQDTCSNPTPSIATLDLYEDLMSRPSWCVQNKSQITLGVLAASVDPQIGAKPRISYSDSSDSVHGEAFLRTVPSNRMLNKVVLQVLRATQTTERSAVVYTLDQRGRDGLKTLLEGSVEAGVCFATTVPVPVARLTPVPRPGLTRTADYESIVRQLVSRRVTQAVFVGGAGVGVELLRAAQRVDGGGSVQWIFSSDVDGDSAQFQNIQMARGLLMVSPSVRHIAEFEDYFVRIDPRTPPPRDPFYQEAYMSENRCRLPGIDYQPYNGFPDCVIPSEQQRREAFSMGLHVEAAVTALYTYARALRNAQTDKCGAGASGLCRELAEMRQFEFLNSYVKDVDFTFSKQERIPSLASSQIEPYLAAKRVRYTASGNLADPMFDIYNYNDRDGTFKFVKVGTSKEGQLDLTPSRIRRYDASRAAVINPPVAALDCSSGGCSCAAGAGAPQHFLQPGDIMFGGFFPVHYKGEGGECGSFNRDGADLAEAFVYAVQTIPRMNILSGVSVGVLAFDSCSSTQRITNQLTNFNKGLYLVEQTNGKVVDPWSTQLYMAGSSEEIKAISMAFDGDSAAQLSYQPVNDALLENPAMSSVSPGVSTVLRSVVAFASYRKWRYTQVISENGVLGQELVKQLKREGSKKGICVGAEHYYSGGGFQQIVDAAAAKMEAKILILNLNPMDAREFLVALNKSDNAGNFIVFSARTLSMVPSFAQFTRTIQTALYAAEVIITASPRYLSFLSGIRANSTDSNPWFDLWYEQVFSCSLDADNMRQYTEVCSDVESTPITSSPQFEPNFWYMNVINSVRLAASALHETLETFCGEGYNGICTNFYNDDMRATFMRNLRDITFMDEQNNEIEIQNGQGDSAVNVKLLTQGANVQVATYLPDSDTLQIQFDLGRSDTVQCAGQCTECLYQYELQSFMELPGDVMIGGVFNVHAADPDSPFSCGAINVANGFQYTEALRFALDSINKGTAPVSLSNVTLGGYALDGCSSGLTSANLMSGLYSGALRLQGGGAGVDVSTVISWLLYRDDSSMQAGATLAQLGVPVVSPDSTSPDTDSDEFPTFFRTSTSDDNLADAIVSLLNNFGWKFIQVVHSADTYGVNGLNVLTSTARNAEICVRSSFEVTEDADTEQLVASLAASTTKVVVIFAPTADVTRIMSARDAMGASSSDLIFVTSRPWGIEVGTLANDMSISFDDNTPDVEAFDEFMAQQEPLTMGRNPWFDEYYQALYQCNLGKDFSYSQSCTDTSNNPVIWANGYRQDPSVYSTLLAVYALTGALDLVLKELCGATYTGICAEFKNSDVNRLIVEKMPEVSFTWDDTEFKFENGQFMSGYKVLRLMNGNTQQVGTFSNGQLRITDSTLASAYVDVESSCDGACLECNFGSLSDEKFTFIPGDIIVAGVFDVHARGDTPYDCGAIKMNQGFQLLEAFNYAIGVVNSKQGVFSGKLGGLTIGGLGLDACESSTRASTLVSNVHAGYLPIKNGNDQVNPGRIDGYVGSLTSDISADIAHVLNVLGIPQVSYGATSSVFSDKDDFPYFLRTVPGDAKLVRAIIALLNKFDLRYVQTVHSRGTYGEEAAAELGRQARHSSVCVAQTVALAPGEFTPESADRVVQRLLRKPRALVVVLFLDVEDINPFLAAVQRSPQAARFRFIGSETWSDNKDVSRGVEDAAANSITLAVETADLVAFDRYLDGKTPSSYSNNPWFTEFYEEMYQCSLTPGSSRFVTECTNPSRGVVRAPRYEQDPYVLYTVNAVYAVALGIHHAIEEACGAGYFGICEAFRNMGERRQKILDGIKKAMFEDATGQTFDFDMNGESNRGYHIYTVVLPVTGKGLYYSNVGSYNDTHLLRIDSTFRVDWESNCDPVGACDECPSLGRQSSRYMQVEAPENLNIVGFFDVHGSDPADRLQCGPLDARGGMQNALAFFYAISEVNRNPDLSLRPDIKLGGIAVDTCDNALRVSQDIYSLVLGDSTCAIASNLDPSSIVAYVASGSRAATAAADLLSPRGVTVITPDAAGVDTGAYDTMLSVVPSAQRHAAAVHALLDRLQWTYVSVIVGARFNASASAFMDPDLIRASCVGRDVRLASSATAADMRAQLRSIDQVDGVRVVVLFTSAEETGRILEAARDEGLDKELQFVLAGDANIDTNDLPLGTLLVQAQTSVSRGFAQWVGSLNLVNHGDIPDDWFEEFWQHALQCKLENSSVVQDYPRICLSTDRLSDSALPQSSGVLHTIIATFMVAHGLDAIRQCHNQPLGIAGCLSQYETRHQLIHEHMRRVEYRVLPRQPNETFTFSFDDRGHGDLGYDIRNYRVDSTGQPRLVKVGSLRDQLLTLNTDRLQTYDSTRQEVTVVSQCPEETVCSCINLDGPTTGSVRTSPVIQSTVSVEERISEVWGIIIVALTAVGILVTICSLVYLIIFYPNRSGTTILGYFLMVGVLCMYALVFAFILYPDDIICSIRKFCLGFVYAMCFSCMLVKVLNTWRLEAYLGEYHPPSHKRLAHPCSFCCIALGLLCVQVIIAVEWLVLEDTSTELFRMPESNEIVPRCAPTDSHNTDLILSCVYVFVLIVLTAVFASLTWDSVENHRESRWIAIATYVTVGIVLVWTIMSTLTDEKYREPVIAVALLVNATVILLCIFVRKIYLLNKIQKEIDEEERKSAYTHSLHGDKDAEFFSSLHTNHAYDVNVDGVSNRGSHAGSGVMYVYNGGADMQF